ncbi:hypothetical protein MKEN_00444100 [Mycena kentingensis (nom. inval.)]|nr:hypothetical protein MKEN_00444100 [Mycena kentingensis (nom. inval.)]
MLRVCSQPPSRLHFPNGSPPRRGAHTLCIQARVPVAKRDAGPCVNLSKDDVKNLPGREDLENKGKDNWGNGTYNLATNIDDQTNYPAQACTASGAIPVPLGDVPSCTATTQKSDAYCYPSTVTLSARSRIEISSTTTTTRTAELSLGVSVSAEIGIPDVVDTTTKISTSVTVTDTLSNAYAWFHLFQPSKKRALNMDNVLSASDRATSLEFKTQISATDLSHYSGSCA